MLQHISPLRSTATSPVLTRPIDHERTPATTAIALAEELRDAANLSSMRFLRDVSPAAIGPSVKLGYGSMEGGDRGVPGT